MNELRGWVDGGDGLFERFWLIGICRDYVGTPRKAIYVYIYICTPG